MNKIIRTLPYCKYAIVLLLFIISLFPINIFANIICNDGSTSPTCQVCEKGCCSKHQGCTNNSNKDSNNNSHSIYKNSKNNFADNISNNEKNDNLKGEDTMSLEDLLILIFLGTPFILGVIGVILEKIRTGIDWHGQGYGK